MISESLKEIDYWLRIVIGVVMIFVLLLVLYEVVLVLRAIQSLRELELIKEVIFTTDAVNFLTGSVTARGWSLD